MNEIKWSKTEKVVARRAFDTAYQRECEALARKLKEIIATVREPADIWRIHDSMTEQRKGIDEKYDYRYSVLVFVFARLLKEGWLKETDLEGLREDKVEKIKYLANR
jgi:hypothetical protein